MQRTADFAQFNYFALSRFSEMGKQPKGDSPKCLGGPWRGVPKERAGAGGWMIARQKARDFTSCTSTLQLARNYPALQAQPLLDGAGLTTDGASRRHAGRVRSRSGCTRDGISEVCGLQKVVSVCRESSSARSHSFDP